jgi:hypothetical protein
MMALEEMVVGKRDRLTIIEEHAPVACFQDAETPGEDQLVPKAANLRDLAGPF